MDSRRVSQHAVIMERIRALAPVVGAHRAEFDALRRMPPAVMQALIEADLLRLWAPVSVGGAGLSARELVDVIVTASEIEGALGWILTNAAVGSRLAGFLPAALAEAWFGAPASLTAVSTATVGQAVPVEDGYRITGRWPFSSGCLDSSRFCGLCQIDNGILGQPDAAANPPIMAFAHLAMTDVAIEDNWHVSGLRGTGSCDVVVNDVFVEAGAVHAFIDPVPHVPGDLYRLPTLSIFPFSVSLVPIGLARAALAEFRDLAGARLRSGSSLPLAEREWVQFEIGKALALQRSAYASVVAALDELADAVESGSDDLVEVRANFRAMLTHSADACAEAVKIVAACAGTSAIRETYRLERIVRDMEAATKHVAMSPNNYLVAGRVALGQPPGVLRF